LLAYNDCLFFSVNSPEPSPSPLNQSISSEYVEVNVQDKQDTLSVLEKLVERLKHGKKLGRRIVCCFRVAMNLDIPYQVLYEKFSFIDSCKHIMQFQLISFHSSHNGHGFFSLPSSP
jgi:hypothetical protein